MKILKLCFLLSSFFIFNSCFFKDSWLKKEAKKNPKFKTAYLVGYNMGEQTKNFLKDEKEQKLFLIGVYHSMKGKEALLDMKDIKRINIKGDTFSTDHSGHDHSGHDHKKHDGMAKKSSDKPKDKPIKDGANMDQDSKTQGVQFLEENKKNSEVKMTGSGLQYKVLKEGTGKNPSATDNVEVHYRGTLIDGTEFDSSYKRNKTITFPLNGVIKGWTEGLQLMKEGAKYKFYIPSELAYGSSGTPGIPPDSVLIFEVELIKVL